MQKKFLLFVEKYDILVYIKFYTQRHKKKLFIKKGATWMVIDGKEIRRYQNFKNLNDYYFQAIKSIARESLTELKFIKIETHNISKTTDSIYFKFKMNHHINSFTLSLRTHKPKEHADHYFYLYLYDYDNLAELKAAIQGQLIDHYNKKANKLGIAKEISEYKKKSHYHQSSVKKKKKNRVKVDNLCLDDSFQQFMKDFHNQNQSTMYEPAYQM